MVTLIQRNWDQNQGVVGIDDDEVHDHARRHDSRTSQVEQTERVRRTRQLAAQRALLLDTAAAAAAAVPESDADGSHAIRLSTVIMTEHVMHASRCDSTLRDAAGCGRSLARRWRAQPRRSSRAPAPPAPATAAIGGRSSSSAATRARRRATPSPISSRSHPTPPSCARRSAQVLWDDLNFEREFYMIPRDTYATIPAARTAEQMSRSLRGANSAPTPSSSAPCSNDAATTIRVQVRLFNVRSRQSVFAKEYSGTATQSAAVRAHDRGRDSPAAARAARRRAHEAGVRLRSQPRTASLGTVEKRDVKEIYIADYDGAEPAAHHGEPAAEPHARPGRPTGARSPTLVPARLSRHLHRR